jgi:hypothetical protein
METVSSTRKLGGSLTIRIAGIRGTNPYCSQGRVGRHRPRRIRPRRPCTSPWRGRRARAGERASHCPGGDRGTSVSMTADGNHLRRLGADETTRRLACAPRPVRRRATARLWPCSLATGKGGRTWGQGVYPARVRAEGQRLQRGSVGQVKWPFGSRVPLRW